MFDEEYYIGRVLGAVISKHIRKYTDKMDNAKNKPKNGYLLLSAAIAAVTGCVAAFALALHYFSRRISEINDSDGLRAALGQMGDYFGGVLNPIIGIATVVLVFITFITQRKELQIANAELIESRDVALKQNKAIQLQSFEQTFFSWLNSYRLIVSEFTLGVGKSSGRAALLKVYEDELSFEVIRGAIEVDSFVAITRSVKLASAENKLKAQTSKVLLENFKLGTPEINETVLICEKLLNGWGEIYRSQEHQLDTLFRTLYRLILWIDEQPELILTRGEKRHYVSIIRSQISHIEAKYLFFNGLTLRGEKFVRLVNTYALFDNLDVGGDFFLRLLKNNFDSHDAYQASAFSSDQARAEYDTNHESISK